MTSFVKNVHVATKEAAHALRSDKGLLFLNLGTATGLLGFCMTDPIPLRSCSIISSGASIFFALTRSPVLSYVPVVWSSLFIAVNAMKISNILLSRLDTTLTELEEEVYSKHFLPFGMRPRQFKRLLEGSTSRSYEAGSLVESETTFPSKTTVKLLTKGEASVFKNNRHLFTIDAEKPICFIGDMSLLELEDSVVRAKPFVSSARAGTQTLLTLEWEQSFLLDILREKTEMSAQLRSVLTNSVMRKLIDIDESNSKSKYITLLRAFAVNGTIGELEKKVLLQYKLNHDISEDVHARGLEVLGWSEAEFLAGHKEVTLAQSLQNLQNKMAGIMERKEQDDVNDIIQNIRKEQRG